MVLSGLLFSYFESFWILLLAAIVGEPLPNGYVSLLFMKWYTEAMQVLSVRQEETSDPLELSRSIVVPICS